jgi:hypothetical protein
MSDTRAWLNLQPQQPGLYAWQSAESADDGSATACKDLDEENSSAWPPVILGLLAATALACSLCRLPPQHSLSSVGLMLTAIGYVAAAILAGAFGVWSVWWILPVKPSLPRGSLVLFLSVGSVWLPALTLLCRENSLWLMVAMALASAITAKCLRANVFPPLHPLPLPTLEFKRGEVPAFAETHPPGFKLWFPLNVSVCMQAAALSWLSGHRLLASGLLAYCTSLLVWRWTTKSVKGKRSNRFLVFRLALLTVFAVLITSAVLAPSLSGGDFGARSRAYLGMQKPESARRQTAATDTSYRGIILWTMPPKKKALALPSPRENSVSIGRIAKPLIIPFDGVYWYFKKPDTQPHHDAHVVHGDPMRVDIHSTDWHPLIMEAHQRLGTPLPLTCCSDLEVTIKNGDNRPGSIALGVILTDSSSPGRPSEYLGRKVVVSSEAGHFSLNRSPVTEMLTFAIPAHARVREFDEITVVFLPARERSLGGEQIAILRFALLP